MADRPRILSGGIPSLRQLRRPGVRWLQTSVLAAVLGLGCAAFAFVTGERQLVVTATAYNSLPGQTQGNPQIGAWGDRLEPDMKVIAVSRDLLEMGLDRGVAVRIEGLPGEYVVLDKLHRRWKRRIDVYMGIDEQAARLFGKRRVKIHWKKRPRR